MRSVELEPWSLGVRFRSEPSGPQRYRVAAGAAADGSPVSAAWPGAGAWVSMVARDGELLAVAPGTVLREGDDVLVLADPAAEPALERYFTAPADSQSAGEGT